MREREDRGEGRGKVGERVGRVFFCFECVRTESLVVSSVGVCVRARCGREERAWGERRENDESEREVDKRDSHTRRHG